MSLLFQLALLALFSCIGLSRGAEKFFSVEGVKKCEIKSAELNECVKKNSYLLWPRLIDGVKEFDIPSIDPFSLNKDLDFSYKSLIISGKLVATKVKLVGLAQLLLKSVDVKVANKKVTVTGTLTLPKLIITGNYSGEVVVTLLTVKPKGGFNLLLEDLEIESKFEADITSRDGHTFANITELSVEPKIGKFHMDVDELELDSVLSKTIISMVNRDWKLFYDFIMPQTRKHWLPYIVELVNRLLKVMPLENAIDL